MLKQRNLIKCARCGEIKQLHCFNQNTTVCKVCKAIEDRTRIQANPKYWMLYRTEKRAKRNGIKFKLKIDDIDIPKLCPILGIPLISNLGGGKPTDNSPTLDRLVPEKGYTQGNVNAISHKANRIKNSGTLEELTKIVQWMKDKL